MYKTNIITKITNVLIVAVTIISLSACNKNDSNTSVNGNIQYTLDGNTYTQTDNINAVFISGKFQGLTDENLEAKVGDSEDISITTGTTYNSIHWFFKINGNIYSSTAGSTSLNKITFTKNETNLLEGTFEGIVKLDGDISNPAKNITGKFTVKDFTRI
jgi:hypothetical protein